MSLQSVGQRFVELCNQGKNFDVMETMYADDIVSVEPTGKQTVGQQAVIDKSRRWAAANTIHGETVTGPFFCQPNQFAVSISFDVTRNDSGQRMTLDELAVYVVENDLITRETFYFGGEKW